MKVGLKVVKKDIKKADLLGTSRVGWTDELLVAYLVELMGLC